MKVFNQQEHGIRRLRFQSHFGLQCLHRLVRAPVWDFYFPKDLQEEIDRCELFCIPCHWAIARFFQRWIPRGTAAVSQEDVGFSRCLSTSFSIFILLSFLPFSFLLSHFLPPSSSLLLFCLFFFPWGYFLSLFLPLSRVYQFIFIPHFLKIFLTFSISFKKIIPLFFFLLPFLLHLPPSQTRMKMLKQQKFSLATLKTWCKQL